MEKSLDEIRVLAMLAGGVSSERMETLLNICGIEFEATDAFLRTLRKTGGTDDLIDALRNARVVNPPEGNRLSPEKKSEILQHMACAAELKLDGLDPEAAEEYRAALRLEPENPALHFLLGLILHNQKELKEAIGEYREAIRLQHDFAQAHGHLGAALCRIGEWDGAIVHLREATRLDPNDAEAYYGLGLALERKMLLQDALGAYRKAHELEPNNEWFRRNYNRVLKGRQGK